jgi:hypothetical protein
VTLSKRERFIGIAVAAVVGYFALDRIAISPLMAQREELLGKINDAELDLARGKSLIASKRTLDRQLSENVARGLTQDPSTAQSQLLNNVLAWAQESGLTVSSLKPNPAPQAVPKVGGKPGEKEKAFLKLTCRATMAGSMQEAGRFMFRLQTSSIPVRITDVTINSKKEGTDDLELTLGLSTIFLAPDAAKEIGIIPPPAAAAPAGSATRPAGTATAPAATRPAGASIGSRPSGAAVAPPTTGPSTRTEGRT